MTEEYNRPYEFEELGMVFSVSPETDLLQERCAASFTEFQRQMNINVYGDTEPYVPPSRWERFRYWLSDNRLVNAWLVLIGREDIDRDYR